MSAVFLATTAERRQPEESMMPDQPPAFDPNKQQPGKNPSPSQPTPGTTTQTSSNAAVQQAAEKDSKR